MSLERLARELEETARQTGEMVDRITEALDGIGALSDGPESDSRQATQEIIMALQAQDRIEQRCHNLANAVRALIASDRNIDHPRFDEIWEKLSLDELSVPEMSGIAARVKSGECDLF